MCFSDEFLAFDQLPWWGDAHAFYLKRCRRPWYRGVAVTNDIAGQSPLDCSIILSPSQIRPTRRYPLEFCHLDSGTREPVDLGVHRGWRRTCLTMPSTLHVLLLDGRLLSILSGSELEAIHSFSEGSMPTKTVRLPVLEPEDPAEP
jgi:hypothetical protein